MKKEQFEEGTIIKGRDLKGYTLCKVLQEDMKMQDFQYQIGENVDVNPLELEGTCKKGLYFIETKNAVDFMEYGSKIAIVEIPEEENVYVDKGKFRTHRLIIKKIMLLNEIDTWKYLFQNGAIIGKNGGIAFKRVMEYGDLNLVKFLIENGADVTAGTNDFFPMPILKNDETYFLKVDISTSNDAIFSAARDGYLDIVKYLYEYGADITANNNSAVGAAAHNGHLDVVKYLHEHGADITANNNSAFESAARNGHLDVVKYLYEHGADITANNNSAVESAVSSGHLDVVKYLCENGADIISDNNIAVAFAAYNGHLDVLKYLCEHGANITADNMLYTAVYHGCLDVVKYLYEHRTEGILDSERIEKFIESAKENGYLDIAEYLQKQ